eukprot:1706129-Rhodomonas_salina.7
MHVHGVRVVRGLLGSPPSLPALPGSSIHEVSTRYLVAAYSKSVPDISPSVAAENQYRACRSGCVG